MELKLNLRENTFESNINDTNNLYLTPARARRATFTHWTTIFSEYLQEQTAQTQQTELVQVLIISFQHVVAPKKAF